MASNMSLTILMHCDTVGAMTSKKYRNSIYALNTLTEFAGRMENNVVVAITRLPVEIEYNGLFE